MKREEYLLKPFIDHEQLIAERSRDGIENHRKGFADLHLVDSDGKPIAGATVKLKQKTHDFKFGANIFMLDEFECEEKNAEYKRLFAETFNMATVPFYWDALEPEEGKPRYFKDSPKVYRRPAPELCLDFCEAHGITPKAHCLHYDHFEPAWLKKYPVEKQWKLLEKRIRECAEHFGDRIIGWEVTNELWWESETTQMYRDPLFMERSFELAERCLTGNELICNEARWPFKDFFQYNRDKYYMQVERALLKGARIDTIGFQFHIWSTPQTEEAVAAQMLDPINTYRVFDTFAMLGKPMQMTEITLPCHDPESREAETLQAELLKRLYTIWFSIPEMESIIYWNLVDGYAHGATPGDFNNGENRLAGGLTHFDLTPKPALKMLQRLMNEEWHTEGELTTDEAGRARFKGFYGNYELEVIADGKRSVHTLHLERTQNVGSSFTLGA